MAAKRLWFVTYWTEENEPRSYKVMARSRRGALSTVWPRYRRGSWAGESVLLRGAPTPSRQRFTGLGRKS